LLRLCARETSGGRFIPQIDGLRSLAVIAVLLYHLDEQLGRPGVTGWLDRMFVSGVRRGFLGVPLFFGISAFIVGMPFALHALRGARAVELGRFYVRRLTRLEPPYILNLVLLWGLGLLLGKWTAAASVGGLGASLIYQHNQIFGYFSTVNSVAWSLEVEFQFYFLAPLFLFVFRVSRAWLRRALILASVVLVVAIRDPENRRVQLSLLGHWESFAAGLLVLDVYLTRWREQLPRLWAWDVAGLLGWLGFFGLSRLEDPTLRSVVQSGCLMAGMLGSLGGRAFSAIFGQRWVFTFGGMCYSFYLWHQVLLIHLVPWLKPWLPVEGGYWVRFGVAALGTIPWVALVCTLAFVGVEKPFMRRDWPARVRRWWQGDEGRGTRAGR
ncbi:MAG: acyltransferase, partial [Verrucomicrobiales bacterium]|nr:acyltransferase [Verrucomicrobiales bacterium]